MTRPERPAGGGWFGAVVRLLLGSRPCRALAVGTLLTAFLATSVLLAGSLVTLSPDQEVTSYLGESDAAVPLTPPGGEQPPGSTFVPPAWHGALSVPGTQRQLVRTSTLPMRVGDGGAHDWVNYVEAPLSTAALRGRFDLVEGREPAAADECVASATVARPARLPFGPELGMVGTIRAIFSADVPYLVCAPGTWASWRLPAAYAPLASLGASDTVYLTGEKTAHAVEAVRRIVSPEEAESIGVRDEALALASRASPQRFLAAWTPLLLLPFAVGLLLGGGFGVWASRTARTLHAVGLPRERISAAACATGVAAAGLGAFAGALLSLLLLPLWRPLATHATAGLPLNDQAPPFGLIAALVGVSVAGTLAGLGLALLGGGVRRSVTVRQKLTLGRREAAGWLIGGLASLGAGLVVIAMADGERWPMILGALAIALGGAALVAPTLWWLAGRLGVDANLGRAVAGRIMHDDARRWCIGAVSVAAVAGVMATTFVYVTSSASALIPLMASPVPQGVAVLRVLDPSGARVPDALVREFEHDVGVGDPVTVHEEFYATGPVWSVATLADLERLAGPLPAEVRARVEQGALLSGKVVTETSAPLAQFTGGSMVDAGVAPVVPWTGGALGRLNHAGGVGLASALPDPHTDAPVLRRIYLGVPDDNAARQWPLQRGLGGVEVLSYTGEATATWSLWTSVSLVGFSLVVLFIASSYARREAEALRPLMGSFAAQGMPSSWARAVLVRALFVFGAVCGVASLGSAALALAVLAANYSRRVFDPAGVPWPVIVAFAASLPVVSVLAGLWATRGRVAPTLSQVE